jgi:hypothetical protein
MHPARWCKIPLEEECKNTDRMEPPKDGPTRSSKRATCNQQLPPNRASQWPEELPSFEWEPKGHRTPEKCLSKENGKES